MHTDACLNSKNSIQPPLKKTILYLDQNAISNLAHARYQTGTQTTKTWLELNEKLEDAVRKQLIICPVSLAHQLESAVNPQLFNAFMGTSEYFAGGCSFTSFDSIKEHQLQTYFTAYLENIAPPFRLDPVDVVEPNPHRWIEVPTIKPNWQMSQEEVDGLRGVRGNSSRECANVFQHWKKFPKGISMNGWRKRFAADLPMANDCCQFFLKWPIAAIWTCRIFSRQPWNSSKLKLLGCPSSSFQVCSLPPPR